MLKNLVWLGAGLGAVLSAAACGGSIEAIGDGAAGSGGSGSSNSNHTAGVGAHSSSGTAGGSSANAGSGSAGTASGNGYPTCPDRVCATGYGCYFSEQNPDGICAPFCDTEEQGQTADADLSCHNALGGGVGTCVFGIGPGNPSISLPGIVDYNNVVTGICSHECDPLAQDCPSGFTCDITATYSAVAQQTLYGCIPDKTPRHLGDRCDSSGSGECGSGLTCSPPFIDGRMTCLAFCDLHDTASCPTGQTCNSTEITTQTTNADVGVCW